MIYRLPTDAEWSTAVGLGLEPGGTPEEKNSKIVGVYPWGGGWPPPKGAGNYAGEESGRTPFIKGYYDGWARTSPVGSFPANKFGYGIWGDPPATALFQRRIRRRQPLSEPKSHPAKGRRRGSRQNSSAFPYR